jgi:hypothetical protein
VAKTITANEKPAVIATMSRSVLYDDGSGPRCEVSYDSAYRLGKDPDRFVRIAAIGEREGVLVHMRDVSFLIEALHEAVRLDSQAS